jgi:hypothetical protein
MLAWPGKYSVPKLVVFVEAILCRNERLGFSVGGGGVAPPPPPPPHPESAKTSEKINAKVLIIFFIAVSPPVVWKMFPIFAEM